MPAHSQSNQTQASFPTTQWSRVIAAGDPNGPGARESLTALCGIYWYPLYAYVRKRGHSPEQAQDLTQDFFTRLLEKGLIAEADPNRGRFRAFLRAVCFDFLANEHDRRNAKKRGGGRAALSIDAEDAEGRYAKEYSHDLTPERIFDRTWALTLLSRVLDELKREYENGGRLSLFEDLKGFLIDGAQAVPYQDLASKLGVSEGAARVAVHRLRRRYGYLLREQIAATVDDPADVDDEIRALFAALAG